ncbi:MAG: type II toxin-antitoxin system RelE/ParE family toxin [Tannerella sp.]|jgi:proteic killer suppression protein|nr:type II toxin-antitoxin system RelE/ParE family toxin [Tannerella sp.]
MIVVFDKEYLRDLYASGKAKDKKHRFQPQVIRKYKERIDLLLNIKNIEELFVMNALNYEVLVGDKKGISSIRVDRQYRIEFTIKGETLSIINILELSNHYS